MIIKDLINFKESTHQYFNKETGEEYNSVSHVISEYKEHFDANKISFFVAKKRGISQKEVLKEWNEIKNYACERGTDFHLSLENFIKFGEIDEQYNKVINSFNKIVNDYILDIKEVHSEILFYNTKYKIAGTSDVCWVHSDNTFTIGDFKTNKKFRYISEYNKWLKFPLNHLMECEFNTYTIQLSLYAYMCEILTGYKCRGLIILYLNSNKGIFEPIRCNYMKHEVMLLLNNYKKHHLS